MIPTREQEIAVLQSVTYAALFDYPLTAEQLHTSLVGVRATPALILSWWRQSEFLRKHIDQVDGWFVPSGRHDLVATRSRREAVSRELIAGNQRILRLIVALPFVRTVALSGSLAHLNGEGEADLDLFVITAPGRVWSVTVTALLLAKLLGKRRRLCLNYVISEAALAIEPRDMFSANQIIHLRPLCGSDVFERFLTANAFVRDLYPNFERDLGPSGHQNRTPTFERLLSLGVAQLAERLARALYGWHLRRHAASWQSRDQVRLERECLKLHTSSHRTATMVRFERAMREAIQNTNDTKGTKSTLTVLA